MTPEPSAAPKVRGSCLNGCGETLTLTEDGEIRCSAGNCPGPGVVAALPANPSPDHFVEFGPDWWQISHPLRELATGPTALNPHRCTLAGFVNALPSLPDPGVYKVILTGDLWTWGTPIEPVPGDEAVSGIVPDSGAAA